MYDQLRVSVTGLSVRMIAWSEYDSVVSGISSDPA